MLAAAVSSHSRGDGLHNVGSTESKEEQLDINSRCQFVQSIEKLNCHLYCLPVISLSFTIGGEGEG